MSQSMYPEIRFVGRKYELEKFDKLLRQPAKGKWALLLYGPGGIGKTQLLKKFLKMVDDYRLEGHRVLSLSEDNLIDLYWTEHRREETLLYSLALKLAPEGFQEFFAIWQEFGRTSGQISDDINLVGLEKLREAFLEGYSKLDAGRIVLAFDTVEQTSEPVLRFFRSLLRGMLRVKPETLVLLAGRPEGKEPILDVLLDVCDAWEIGSLSQDDISRYLKSEGISGLQDKAIQQITELVEGRPIRVALVIDWLKEGHTIEELLESSDLVDIDRNLVKRVASVKYPEDWLILYMALFDRRFNEEFVPVLLPSASEQRHEHLEEMKRFSFVKYYPPLPNQMYGNWQLHDEMRDLLNRHLWPEEDPTGETRRRARKSVIKQYYDWKISDIQGWPNPDKTSIQILKQERLHYQFPTDFELGFESYRELAKQAESDQEASFLEALNDEVKLYEVYLDKYRLKNWQIYQVIAGAISSDHTLRDYALKLVEYIDWQKWDVVSQAELRYRLAQIYNKAGQQQLLFELCALAESETNRPEGKWINWFRKQLARELSTLEHSAIIADFGRLLTTVGTAYRSQNRLHHAVAHFQEAIRLYETIDDMQLAIANVQNNLGYVYQRLGRTDEALAECQAALDIRRRLGRLDQLGYSYNVIGTIRVEQLRPEEAETCFKQALSCFEKANVESGRGLVLIAYGRLLRQWGEYREISGEALEKSQKFYEDSLAMLLEAVTIFRRLGERPNLMEAINETGTLMRQMQRWDDAISYYKESLNIARVMPNQYREADNECDLGILYFRKSDLKHALEHSERAAKIASKIQAYYLKSKARQTSASVYMQQKQYELAFAAAADAATGILRLSPDRFVESAAKRTLEYERVLQWLREKVILQLPHQDLVEQIISMLIERWKSEVVETSTGKRLADEFPGFISAMERVKRDYSFLKNRPEVSV